MPVDWLSGQCGRRSCLQLETATRSSPNGVFPWVRKSRFDTRIQKDAQLVGETRRQDRMATTVTHPGCVAGSWRRRTGTLCPSNPQHRHVTKLPPPPTPRVEAQRRRCSCGNSRPDHGWWRYPGIQTPFAAIRGVHPCSSRRRRGPLC